MSVCDTGEVSYRTENRKWKQKYLSLFAQGLCVQSPGAGNQRERRKPEHRHRFLHHPGEGHLLGHPGKQHACAQATHTCRHVGAQLKTSASNIVSLLQPILSPSILDHLINNDRKLPPEYNLPHTYVETQVSVWQRLRTEFSQQWLSDLSLMKICQQSLQIAAFLFTVCHVVILVQDWFTDVNLYRWVPTSPRWTKQL